MPLPRQSKPLPTRERILELLDVDLEEGKCYWRVNRGPARMDERAGTRGRDGYHRIGIDCRIVYEHWLMFFMAHGRWPAEYLDHINLNRSDNRPENLREVTHIQNHQNRKIKADNKSGFPGIRQEPNGKWIAQIGVNRRNFYLGTFTTKAAAMLAYIEARQEKHPGAPSEAILRLCNLMEAELDRQQLAVAGKEAKDGQAPSE